MSKLPANKYKRFVTSTFRKATFGGFCTNFDFFDTCQVDIVHTLLFWYFKLSGSSMENFYLDVEQMRTIFQPQYNGPIYLKAFGQTILL